MTTRETMAKYLQLTHWNKLLYEKGIITHVFRQAVTQTQLETAVLEAMGRM